MPTPEGGKRRLRERYVATKPKITSGIKTRSKHRLDKWTPSSLLKNKKSTNRGVLDKPRMDSDSDCDCDIEYGFDSPNGTRTASSVVLPAANVDGDGINSRGAERPLHPNLSQNRQVYRDELGNEACNGFSNQEAADLVSQVDPLNQTIDRLAANLHGKGGHANSSSERDGSNCTLPPTDNRTTDERTTIVDEDDIKRECKGIAEAIRTFGELENCRELEAFIEPNYKLLNDRILALSDQTVFLHLIDKYHGNITSMSETLAEVKTHLERVARRG